MQLNLLQNGKTAKRQNGKTARLHDCTTAKLQNRKTAKLHNCNFDGICTFAISKLEIGSEFGFVRFLFNLAYLLYLLQYQ